MDIFVWCHIYLFIYLFFKLNPLSTFKITWYSVMTAKDTWASSICSNRHTGFNVKVVGNNPLQLIFSAGKILNVKCKNFKCHYCMCEMGRHCCLSHVNYDCRLNEHWVQLWIYFTNPTFWLDGSLIHRETLDGECEFWNSAICPRVIGNQLMDHSYKQLLLLLKKKRGNIKDLPGWSSIK